MDSPRSHPHPHPHPLASIFDSPPLVFHILSFSSVTDLLSIHQHLSTTAYKLVKNDGFLLLTCLKNSLGIPVAQPLDFPSSQDSSYDLDLMYFPNITNLLSLAKFCQKWARDPPPMQMLGFRSSIGTDQPPLFPNYF